MALIVQKFGGTSVESPKNRKAALKQILSAKKKGYDVVVVVSAMGRKGDPYATDTLIELLKSQNEKPCPKKKDLIMACGEIISASVMAAYIEANGIEAEAITGFQAGIVTTSDFGNAEIVDVNPAYIKEKLREGKVVVVAGFQGQTKKGEITTLGRGGSDTTAVALGGYLKADMVEIYTDVPGIAVADPRLIPEVPFLSRVSYDEVLAMAESGAKVIHPRAVKAGKDFNIPLRIKSTFEKGEGTLISSQKSGLIVSGISIQRDFILAFFEREVAFSTEETKELLNLDEEKTVSSRGKNRKVIIITEEKIDRAKALAAELDAKIEFREGLARVSVVYKQKKLQNNDKIFLEDIPVELERTFADRCYYFVPDEYGQKTLETIFNRFFVKK